MAAIDKAGGYTELAKIKHIKLLRNGHISLIDLRKMNPDGSNNPPLEAGDVICFPY
jgi:protein involved in polysaccharide export with SLBB domain